MKSRYIYSLLFAFTLMISIGCSSSSKTPADTIIPASNGELVSENNHSVIGSGTLLFDTSTGELKVVENRDASAHFNVTGFLSGGCPGGCFRFSILNIINNIYTVQMTLENPSSLQVWDARIFLNNILGKKVLNPDGFSDYYTDAAWIPFINFVKENPDRAFPVGPGGMDTELLIIDFSGDVNPGVDYIVDVSLGGQLPEPYQIDPIHLDGVFFSNAGKGARVIATVYDHQGDPVVTLNANQIGLGPDVTMYDDGLHGDSMESDGIFGTEYLVPTVAPGEYSLTVRASDTPGYPTIRRSVQTRVYRYPQMILIPEGQFTMGNGSADPYVDDQSAQDEKPRHTHPTDAYYIGKYELRVDEYRAFVEDNGYDKNKYWGTTGWLVKEDMGLGEPLYWDDPSFCGPNKQDHPMIGLCWYEAEAFCNWLTDVSGETWRLPSEAEWERAARGDSDDRYLPWGNVWNVDYSNNRNDTIDTAKTSPVGLYSPSGDSPWGCADMIGNACEWTSDWYSSDIYSQYEQGDFTPATSGSQKVTRGAVWWIGNQLYLRVSFRWNRSLMDFDDANGMRLVKEVSN
jgi:formylglycine-generating enzyme required for sulfatase activity